MRRPSILARRPILQALGFSPWTLPLGYAAVLAHAGDDHGLAWHQAGDTAAPWIEITTDGAYRHIRSNGIPNHPVGTFPNADNPNALSAQSHAFRVPLAPTRAPSATPLGLHPFGVAVNGVPLDPQAAEWWNRDPGSGWQYEALSGAVRLGLDASNGHVQPGGAYHYHGLPLGLVDEQAPHRHSALIGYAADGFPVYARYGQPDGLAVRAVQPSYRLKVGMRDGGPGGAYDGTFVEDYEYVPGLGDLDEANGLETVTPDHPGGTYAYFLTDAFPVIPRLFAGTPDPSFLRGPGPGGAPLGPGTGRPPPGQRPIRH